MRAQELRERCASAADHLVKLGLDPAVGDLEAICEPDGGLPAELFPDEGIVTVAPAHTLGARDVPYGQLLPVKSCDGLHHLIHADLRWTGIAVVSPALPA